MMLRSMAVIAFLSGAAAWAQETAPALSPDAALNKLLQGNQRYMRHKEQHPDESVARRKELVSSQHPFAVILSCADSRVPPELVFDEGLGDLFVIRVAGNIVDDAVLGSIEYAVEHLGTKLVLVLGHETCGAVTAAIQGGKAPGHLSALVAAIQPSVEATANLPGDRVHLCVLENSKRVARQIRQSEPILKEAVDRNELKVVAADYALDTGKVTVLEDHP
jgi:carbonic anhydrase